ncbi:MAG TPA: DUF3568 family protein [Opitutales bacterium]|nr:DUF3568 family protein [Opitutales bacterium]
MKTKNSILRTTSVLMLAGSVLLTTPGCWVVAAAVVAGAAAATGVAYAEGELTASFGKNYEDVAAATIKAVDQLGFAKPEERKDALTDTIDTHTAKGDSVHIVLTKQTESSTKISIRIGTFGDEQTSRSILSKIESNLGGGS